MGLFRDLKISDGASCYTATRITAVTGENGNVSIAQTEAPSLNKSSNQNKSLWEPPYVSTRKHKNAAADHVKKPVAAVAPVATVGSQTHSIEEERSLASGEIIAYYGPGLGRVIGARFSEDHEKLKLIPRDSIENIGEWKTAWLKLLAKAKERQQLESNGRQFNGKITARIGVANEPGTI